MKNGPSRQPENNSNLPRSVHQNPDNDTDSLQTGEAELQKNYQILSLLNKLLALSLEDLPLSSLLDEFIQIVTSFPGLSLNPQGAIFLKDENSDTLLLTSHHGLDEQLLTSCKQVAFGTCLCGRAAQTGQVLSAGQVGDLHDIHYHGMIPHGHYCVPIIASNKKLLGVFTLYVAPGQRRDPQTEETLMAIAGVVAGIIERKKTEESLNREKSKLESLFAAMDDGVTVQDTNFRIIYQNMPHIDRQGNHLGEFCYEAYQKRETVCDGCILAKCFQDGKVHRRQTTAETSQGTMYLEVSASPIKDREGNIVAGIEVVRDITEHKKLSAHLQQAQKMEAIGTMAGGIAHDFNNILSAILGFSDLARHDIPPGNPASQYLEEVIVAGNRAKEVVKQILTFSRRTDLELQPVKFSLMVKEAIKLARISIPATVEFKQRIDPDSGYVMATPTQLHQILTNLCANAYHAMQDKGGTLEVRLQPVRIGSKLISGTADLCEGSYEKLTVRDTGHGIDPDIIDRIFEPYFTTKGPNEGSGMGLSVTLGIVKDLNGAITVTSKVGEGTAFEVLLPQMVVQDSDALDGEADFIPTGTEHILFVDDEEPLIRVGKRILERLGYCVTPRTSSIEALEAFRVNAGEFDLVITDQLMPNMTGLKLAEEMKKIRADIPIILMTGFSESAIDAHGKKTGINALVNKPVIRGKLARIIRQVLDQKSNIQVKG